MTNSEHVPFSDFAKLDMRIGEVLGAERVPDTDKLLRLLVNVGEDEPRQIISGIASYVSDPADLVGKRFPFVLNLEPRIIRGHESRGMLLAVSAGAGDFSFLTPSSDVPPGSSIR